MSIFGDLERLIDDIYPYRWLILAIVLAGLGVFTFIAHRRGWHHVIARNKLMTAFIVVPTLVIAIPVGYYVLSPLWTRTTLEEVSPLAAVSASRSSTPILTQRPAAPTADVPTPTIPPTEPQPAIDGTATSLPESTMVTEPTPVATPEPDAADEPAATPTPEPTQQPTTFVPHVVSQGQLAGADDFHFAEGTALLIETEPGIYVLRLEDFSVRNGPDLFVYISPSAEDVVDGALNLGGLKATDGSINYDIPSGTDISQFSGVVIWCRQFSVLFGTAPLG